MVMVTTTIRFRFDCSSSTLQPFDDLHHDDRWTGDQFVVFVRYRSVNMANSTIHPLWSVNEE